MLSKQINNICATTDGVSRPTSNRKVTLVKPIQILLQKLRTACIGKERQGVGFWDDWGLFRGGHVAVPTSRKRK